MQINQQKTITTIAIRPLLRLLEPYNIPLNDILQNTLIDECMLNNDRLPIAGFDQLLNNIVNLTKLDNIGFITGQELELKYLRLLGFLLSRCETGRAALITLRRYYLLLNDNHAPEIFITKGEVKVIYLVPDGNDLAMRARAELIMTSIHLLGCSLGGNLYQPINIGFKHNKPKYHAQLTEFFSLDIAYNQAEYWVSFAAKHIDKPLQYPNQPLIKSLGITSEKLLESYQKLDSSSSTVRYVLQQLPNQHTANKETVAELLNTSPRTLTRRLQEENTRFSNILRDVRMEKAQVKLKNQFINIKELAHDLGFSDRSGFERAYKQWTGTTPYKYQKYWKKPSSTAVV
jgi:AraC-like DNA-binding protein